MYLASAKATFAAVGFDTDDAPSFCYVKHVVSGDTAVLESETEMGGTYVNGVDIIRASTTPARSSNSASWCDPSRPSMPSTS